MRHAVFHVFPSLRLRENEQRAKVLQQEREYYSTQARTLQQSLSQLTADKQQTEAELKVTRRDSAARSSHSNKTRLRVSLKVAVLISCCVHAFKYYFRRWSEKVKQWVKSGFDIPLNIQFIKLNVFFLNIFDHMCTYSTCRKHCYMFSGLIGCLLCDCCCIHPCLTLTLMHLIHLVKKKSPLIKHISSSRPVTPL